MSSAPEITKAAWRAFLETPIIKEWSSCWNCEEAGIPGGYTLNGRPVDG